MGRCELVWTTAGTNRVCSRCLALKGSVVGYTDESGVTLPPLHPRCRCAIAYREVGKSYNPASNATGIEMPRRRRAQDGHEIIDKPTYHRLTNWFERSGGIIIRGEEAKRHLANSGASASYFVGANVAFITDDATISDVLEEMYHAKQDRAKMFGSDLTMTVILKREIDAQKYLIRVADKYKIPVSEREVTKRNLEEYEKQLAKRNAQ